MPEDKSLQRGVRVLRAWAGFSQTELARMVGLSPSMISLIENEMRPPSRKTWDAVVQATSAPRQLVAMLDNEPPSQAIAVVVSLGRPPEVVPGRQVGHLVEWFVLSPDQSFAGLRMFDSMPVYGHRFTTMVDEAPESGVHQAYAVPFADLCYTTHANRRILSRAVFAEHELWIHLGVVDAKRLVDDDRCVTEEASDV